MPDRPPPELIAAAHGSRAPEGARLLQALAAGLRAARPGLPVRLAFLDHREPSPAAALAGGRGPAVVVPLLLAAGTHQRRDLAAAVAAAPRPAVLSRPIGPDPRLAVALADRLAAAGAPPDVPVVLAAVGSRQPEWRAGVRTVARRLAELRGGPVEVGFWSGAPPGVAEVTDRLASSAGPVAVASYLLAAGRFATLARGLPARWVSAPIGGHPQLLATVLTRYDRARAAGRGVRKACGRSSCRHPTCG